MKFFGAKKRIQRAADLGAGYALVPYKDLVQTFTAAQTISGAGTATLLTITGADDGAAAGPFVVARRTSATPAGNDAGPGYAFQMRDSGANDTNVAQILSRWLDPTNTSEDASLDFLTIAGGTLATRMALAQGLQIGSPTGGDLGQGQINATDYNVNGVSIAHGLAQPPVRAENTNYVTNAANQIPYDNSVPQSGEGSQILSVSITPKLVTSTLKVQVDLQVGSSNNHKIIAALFVDAEANARMARSVIVGDPTHMEPLPMSYYMTSGTTSALTFKVRFGADVGTAYLNGNDTSRIFGGVSISSITVMEFLP